MKNILVPVGSVENGINNLHYAVNFASITGARVYVTCIKSENTEAVIREILENVDTKKVQVVSKPISGDIYEGISELSRHLKVDLMILSPRSISISDEVYLGKVTGKIVRESNTPLLIVPKNYLFRRFDSILMAFKNANFNNQGSNLETIEDIQDIFRAKLHLLHVRTPDAPKEASIISEKLLTRKESLTETSNATVFQGVIEHYQTINPEMICLLRRRKQNMFEKFWQNNRILKSEFFTTKPLLILRERE